MVQYNPLQYLPSAEELPDSDDTPVDNLGSFLRDNRSGHKRAKKEKWGVRQTTPLFSC